MALDSMKKKTMQSLLGTVVVVLFFSATIWYIFDHWSEFSKLTIAEPLYIIPAVLFMIINIYASGIVIDLAIEPHGIKLTKREAFGLASITRFSNQLSPSYVGATIRAAYIKRTHGVSYAKFSSSFIISNLLQFMISGLLTIATFLALMPSSNNNILLYFVALGVIVLIGLVYFPVGPMQRFIMKQEQRGGKTGHLLERVSELLKGYVAVRSYPHLLPRTMAWMLVITFTFAINFFLLYNALGFHVSIISAFFIASLSGWSILIAITPGGLGIREGLMLFGAQIAGVPLSATLLVAVLLRILMFIGSGVLSAYFAPKLLHTSVFGIGAHSKK